MTLYPVGDMSDILTVLSKVDAIVTTSDLFGNVTPLTNEICFQWDVTGRERRLWLQHVRQAVVDSILRHTFIVKVKGCLRRVNFLVCHGREVESMSAKHLRNIEDALTSLYASHPTEDELRIWLDVKVDGSDLRSIISILDDYDLIAYYDEHNYA